MAKRTALISLALAVCSLFPAASRPQATSQATPSVAFTATVDLVQVPIVVFDDHGAVATGLTKRDFRITEDGVPQTILNLDKDRQPTSFVILADVSQSMTNKIPFVQAATQSVLEPPDDDARISDEFSLLSFQSRVDLLVPFTQDYQDLLRRVPALLEPTKGGTALLDAVYVGTNQVRNFAKNHRRAVIVISDGGDNHSRYNLRRIREFLEEADVPVFAVMAGPAFEMSDLLPPIPRKKPRLPALSELPFPSQAADYIGEAERRGPQTLKSLTEVTGGGVFTAQNLDSLPRIVQTIGLAVRYEYVLSYKPGTGDIAKRPNNRHQIHLELAPDPKFAKYSIHYKHGYYSENPD